MQTHGRSPMTTAAAISAPVVSNIYRAGDRLSGGTRAGIPGTVVVLSSYDHYVDLAFVPDGASVPSDIAFGVAVQTMTLLPMRSSKPETEWTEEIKETE